MSTTKKIILFFLIGVLIGMAIYSQEAKAGPVINFAFGHVIGDYSSADCVPNGTAVVHMTDGAPTGTTIGCVDGDYLGGSGWLGMYGVGWEFDDIPLFWKAKLRITPEIVHMSDPRLSDGGIEYGMVRGTVHW